MALRLTRMPHKGDIGLHILVTRPSDDGAQTARLLERSGHTVLVAPLLETRFLDAAPMLDDVQAILATSANGVRAFAQVSARRDLPLFAVGPQTSEAARAAGFVTVRNADGDAEALAAAVQAWAKPQEGALLHICSQSSSPALAEDLRARHFRVRREILYAVEAASALPADAAAALRARALDAALFFSPMSARVFATCVRHQALPVTGMIAVCISAATAAEVQGLGFAETRIAPAPNQDSLFACLD